MAKRTYLWCDNCRRSFDYPDAPGGNCPICGNAMRELGWLTAFVRGVMAQELVPSQTGTVSALMMGFAWGAAGFLFVPAAGYAADLFSLHHVMAALLVFPVGGFFLARMLPEGRHRSAR